MSYFRSIQGKNGNYYVALNYYKCDCCNEEIFEADRFYTEEKNKHLCMECAFKSGKITSKEYLNSCGVNLDNYYAAINPDGIIITWSGSPNYPWLRTNKQDRRSPEYKQWRNDVFKRDNYTCQDCNQHGGKLNAHHLKPFSKYKKLRYKVSNGITLCEDCHKKRHGKKLVV